MVKERFSQLELFTQPGPKAQNAFSKQYAASLRKILPNYEKGILLIIGFIITCVIAFSAGVEKGKRTAMLKSGFRFDTAAVKKIQAPLNNQPAARLENPLPEKPPAEKPPAERPLAVAVVSNAKGYTIQLATYQTKAYAQKEVNALKKKGFSPIVRSKGAYTILYVGNFSNKNTAQSLSSKLEKKYKGCYVRRL